MQEDRIKDSFVAAQVFQPAFHTVPGLLTDAAAAALETSADER